MASPASPRDDERVHPVAPLNWISKPNEWMRKLAETTNGIMQGRTNNRGEITLSAGTTTVLLDPRIDINSVIIFMPRTAIGASLVAGLYVSGVGEETATLNHATPSSGTQILDFVVWS